MCSGVLHVCLSAVVVWKWWYGVAGGGDLWLHRKFPKVHFDAGTHSCLVPSGLQLRTLQLRGLETDQGGSVAEWEFAPTGGLLLLTPADMPQVRLAARRSGI